MLTLDQTQQYSFPKLAIAIIAQKDDKAGLSTEEKKQWKVYTNMWTPTKDGFYELNKDLIPREGSLSPLKASSQKTPQASPSRKTPQASPSRKTPQASPSRKTPQASPSRKTPQASPSRKTPQKTSQVSPADNNGSKSKTSQDRDRGKYFFAKLATVSWEKSKDDITFLPKLRFPFIFREVKGDDVEVVEVLMMMKKEFSATSLKNSICHNKEEEIIPLKKVHHITRQKEYKIGEVEDYESESERKSAKKGSERKSVKKGSDKAGKSLTREDNNVKGLHQGKLNFPLFSHVEGVATRRNHLMSEGGNVENTDQQKPNFGLFGDWKSCDRDHDNLHKRNIMDGGGNVFSESLDLTFGQTSIFNEVAAQMKESKKRKSLSGSSSQNSQTKKTKTHSGFEKSNQNKTMAPIYHSPSTQIPTREYHDQSTQTSPSLFQYRTIAIQTSSPISEDSNTEHLLHANTMPDGEMIMDDNSRNRILNADTMPDGDMMMDDNSRNRILNANTMPDGEMRHESPQDHPMSTQNHPMRADPPSDEKNRNQDPEKDASPQNSFMKRLSGITQIFKK